jgi:hypothetical protein
MAAETTDNSVASVTTGAGDVLAMLRGYRNIGRVLGFLGAAGLVMGLVVGIVQGDKTPFAPVLHSYVFGYTFWLCLSLGCLAVLFLQSVVKSAWGMSIVRIMEAGAKTLPIMALLFLPFAAAVWAGHSLGFHLYHWADPATVAADPVLQHKSKYLNPVFWTIRAVFFFGFWIFATNFLSKSGLKQDQTKDQRLAQQRVDWGAPGGVLFVITLTFAFTDWLMSLDPHWLSTIYGVWWMVTSMLAALALGTLFVTSQYKKRPYSEIISPLLTKDLGNMLLAFTMLWAYISLSQFLIYWSGNLPEYNTFFVRRFEGPLVYVGAFLIFAQFFGPFLALLSGKTKRTPELLRSVAAWILVIRFVDVFWQVVPFFGRGFTAEFAGAYLLDLAAWAFVGGVWVTVFVGELRRHPLIPLYDTRLIENAREAHH